MTIMIIVSSLFDSGITNLGANFFSRCYFAKFGQEWSPKIVSLDDWSVENLVVVVVVESWRVRKFG